MKRSQYEYTMAQLALEGHCRRQIFSNRRQLAERYAGLRFLFQAMGNGVSEVVRGLVEHSATVSIAATTWWSSILLSS